MLIEEYLAHVIELTEKTLNELTHTLEQAKTYRELARRYTHMGGPNLGNFSHPITKEWPVGSQRQEDIAAKLTMAEKILNDCLSHVANPENIGCGTLDETPKYLFLHLRDDVSVEAVQHTLKGVIERLYQLKHWFTHKEEWKYSPEHQCYENAKLNAHQYAQIMEFIYSGANWNVCIGFAPQSNVVTLRRTPATEDFINSLTDNENPYNALSRVLQTVREPSADLRTREADLEKAGRFVANCPAGIPACSLLLAELRTRILCVQSTLINAKIDELLAKIASQTVSVDQFQQDILNIREQSRALRLAHRSIDSTVLEVSLFMEYVDQYLHCVSEGFSTLEMDDIRELPMTSDAVVKLRDAKNGIQDNVDRSLYAVMRFMTRALPSEIYQITMMVFRLDKKYDLNLYCFKDWPDLCTPLLTLSMFDPVFIALCDEYPEAVLRAYISIANSKLPSSLEIAQKALFRIYRVYQKSPSLPVLALLSLGKHLQAQYKDIQKGDPQTNDIRTMIDDLVAGLQRKAPPVASIQEFYEEISGILAVPARNAHLRVRQVNSAKMVFTHLLNHHQVDQTEFHKICNMLLRFEFRDTMMLFDELLVKARTSPISHLDFQHELSIIHGHCPKFLPSTTLVTVKPSHLDLPSFEQYLEIQLTIATLRLLHTNPVILALIPPVADSVLFLRESMEGDSTHLAFIMMTVANYVKTLPEAEQPRVALLMFRLSRQFGISIQNSLHTKDILEPLTKLDIHSSLFEEACDHFPSQLLVAYSELATARSPKSMHVAHAALTRIVKQRYEGKNVEIPITTLECLSFARKLLAEYKRFKKPDPIINDKQFTLLTLIKTLSDQVEREERLHESVVSMSQYQ